jgi:hypothetical protein
VREGKGELGWKINQERGVCMVRESERERSGKKNRKTIFK